MKNTVLIIRLVVNLRHTYIHIHDSFGFDFIKLIYIFIYFFQLCLEQSYLYFPVLPNKIELWISTFLNALVFVFSQLQV